MKKANKYGLGVAAASVAALLATQVHLHAQPAADAVSVRQDELGGVVTGPKGPEAGVWVIAETTDLPTKFSRTVVTDDRGRYVVPDLPKANYNVWVRGYGLVDSPKVQSARAVLSTRPGSDLCGLLKTGRTETSSGRRLRS